MAELAAGRCREAGAPYRFGSRVGGGVHRFFYLHLSSTQAQGSALVHGTDEYAVGYGEYLVKFYGIPRFIADLDRDRDFCADRTTVVSAGLDWIANEGFREFFGEQDYDFPYNSAHEFRQRHLLHALERKGVF